MNETKLFFRWNYCTWRSLQSRSRMMGLGWKRAGLKYYSAYLASTLGNHR